MKDGPNLNSSKSGSISLIQGFYQRLAASVLTILLFGCQAITGSISTTANIQSTTIGTPSNPQSDEDNNSQSTNTSLPIIDLVTLGNKNSNSLGIQSLTHLMRGFELGRIKVRQASDLNTPRDTVLAIKQNGTYIMQWQGSGSYDIIWDGTDKNGADIPDGPVEILLLKLGSYRTAGFATLRLPVFLDNFVEGPILSNAFLTLINPVKLKIRAILDNSIGTFPLFGKIRYKVAGPKPSSGELKPSILSRWKVMKPTSDPIIFPGEWIVIFPDFNFGSNVVVASSGEFTVYPGEKVKYVELVVNSANSHYTETGYDTGQASAVHQFWTN